jgi:hypothetical protein
MRVSKIVGSGPWRFHRLMTPPISAANRLGKSTTPWQCIHAMFSVMVVALASSGLMICRMVILLCAVKKQRFSVGEVLARRRFFYET